jgi:glycosyltransferase involved in cell wall biosynthesis
MRVLIAVHHFLPRYTNGAEIESYTLAKGLQKGGHEVRIICIEQIDAGPAVGVNSWDDVYDGIPVHRLSLNHRAIPEAFRYSYENPWIGNHLRSYLLQHRVDVLHLISGYLLSGSVLQVAQESDIPTVVSLMDFWFLCPRITLLRSDNSLCSTAASPADCALCLRKERRRYRYLDRWSAGLIGKALCVYWQGSNDALMRSVVARRNYLFSCLNQANAVISASRFVKERIEAQGIHLSHFYSVRQGLDCSQWDEGMPAPMREAGLSIGYIGQIAPHKGVGILLDAFLQLCHTPRESAPKLLLYGDLQQFPDFVAQLRRKIVGRTDVALRGRFDHRQIRRVHAGIDVLVVPSLWYENSPNVILEAFECGTPVVVSRLGGMAELVQEGVNGLQFQVGKAQDLARVLRSLLDEPQLLDQLRRGIPPVKTIDQELDELLGIYATCGSIHSSGTE